jgi:hypothetical protein
MRGAKAPLYTGPLVDAVMRLCAGLERHREETSSCGTVVVSDSGSLTSATTTRRGDWLVWRRNRAMRTRSSHAYAAVAAGQIAVNTPAFPAAVMSFRDRPQRRPR